jgi:hypothetical protein
LFSGSRYILHGPEEKKNSVFHFLFFFSSVEFLLVFGTKGFVVDVVVVVVMNMLLTGLL